MVTRRQFLSSSLRSGASIATANVIAVPLGCNASPAIVRAEADAPQIPFGVQSGDISPGRAIIWSRTDRLARMRVEYATTPAFRDARMRRADPTGPDQDFTARVELTDLPAGQRLFYRVTFETDAGVQSQPVVGELTTSPLSGRSITIAWGGDTAGQGWGIDTARGGMRIYEAMRRVRPDLFIHSGDSIYADGPIAPAVMLDDGSVWKNVVTEEVSRVAETLRDFRGRYKYNLLDENMRAFNREVPCIAQWDDHEVTNNWWPNEVLTSEGTDARYSEKHVRVLAERARQAFLEYTPTRINPADPHRIFRRYRYGPLLDIVVLDARSYRGDNSANRQSSRGPDTAILGRAQLEWIKQALSESRATWKLVACDMPLGLVVPDGPAQEGFANADPALLGREFEIADLLSFLKARRVRNVVWVTADVHYAAAHHYSPERAAFENFDPFWEFVAGPLHAGTFGPNQLDATFGPQVRFLSIPATGFKPNRPPSEGLQFFGLVHIDGRTASMRVTLHDITGKEIFRQELERMTN
jgi:alkaline phosphatase D